jgi:hypothetical protein
MHKVASNSFKNIAMRRAQSLNADLSSAIWRVCQQSPEVAACYVLDFQKQDTGQTGIFIVLSVDQPQQMEQAAPRFIEMLQQFPSEMHAGKIFVASSQTVDVSRFSGAEFYVRQAEPHARATVQPPVDLDKPVENPALSAALDGYVINPSTDTQQELFRQLRNAVFLVPMLADEMQMTPGAEPGVGTIEKDSVIKIFACADSSGASHLPLFTDWPAIQSWTDRKVSTLVMPASDAWSFVLSQPQYMGAFVNPGSQRLQLSRDLIQYLQDSN